MVVLKTKKGKETLPAEETPPSRLDKENALPTKSGKKAPYPITLAMPP